MPPFNGSGQYTLTAGQPVVAGTDILDSTFNTLTADLATALSTCVTRDGQSPPTTNLPMGSFKLTGLAAGTAAGHSVRFEQLQTGANKLITVAGTGDVITGVMTPTYGAYTNGDMFTFIVGSTNTTNVTINIDGLGAKAITNGTTALTAGALTANRVVVIQYDGTRFQLLNSAILPVASGGTGVTTSTGTGAVVLGTSPTLTTPTISSLSSASATALTLQSAGTTAITVDTSQNVGIGTSSPAYKLDVAAPTGSINVASTTGTNYAKLQVMNTGGSFQLGIENSAGSNYSVTAYSRVLWNDGAYPTVFFTSSAERMRIDSSGNLLVGTTSVIAGSNAIGQFSNVNAGRPGIAVGNSAGSSATNAIIFINSNGTVGSIQTSGSATSYNTSSDYRLKNTIAPMTGALDKVALLKPCTYKWNADGSDGQGFIAHELQEVVEGCVTGEKDATREEEYEVSPAVPAVLDAEGVETTPAVQAVKGTRTVPSYQGVDTSFLVATLTSAIQEQQAMIMQLQADVAALKR